MNTPSGVAGLDASGNMTAGVLSPVLTGSPTTSNGAQPLVNMGRFPIVNAVGNAADPFQSPDALYVGGLPIAGWAVNGAANSQQARPGSVVVSGQPWGPYNAATLESLLMSNGVDSQNGVCAADWRQGAGHFCGADGVGQYIGVTNVAAMIVGNVASYTANSVVLKTPLTAAQMAQLRIGMYITTNTVNATTVPTSATDSWGNQKIAQQNYYLSVISGWSADGTTISVSGWDIPWASSHPSGQVPGAQTGDALDTWSSNYGAQVVFIGNPDDGSARNEYLDYKGYIAGDDSTGATQNVGQATALAHQLTGDELDLRYWATRPNEVHLDGLTISIAGDSGTPLGRAALTPDSYGLAISGDVHNSLELDGPSDGNTILSHSFYLHGQEGVDTQTSGVNRPVQTLFGFTGQVDGDSAYNLMGWLKKDNTTANGIGGASFHLGIVDNGYANTLDPSQNGAGEIVWNQGAANVGGLSLCGANACGLDVASGGQVSLDQQMNAKAPIAMQAGQGIQFIPSDNNGFSYWVAPPSVGGLTLSAKTYQGGDASITGYNGTFSGGVTAASATASSGILGTTDWLGAWALKNGTDSYARGFESALFGGVTATGEGNNTWTPRSVFVQSDPYGPYSNGCAFGVAMTGSNYSSQFPVSEQDPTQGAASVVGVGGFDTVANCSIIANTPARLILTATGYTATSVKLASALTAAQAAQIHPFMYITTNSPNTALSPASTTGQLPARNLYAGFVSTAPSSGDTSISVYAWDVPGIGSGVSGQVPQTATLDTAYSAYTSPTVFLGGGAAGSAFAHNWFFNVDAADLTPSTSNRSLIHQVTPLEVDLNVTNGTAPAHSIAFTGINMNAGNQPNALTTDSHDAYLGGNIADHLITDGACGNVEIRGNGYWFNTQCNTSTDNLDANIAEFDDFADGANNMRLVYHQQRTNTSAPVGWESAVPTLGVFVDGDRGTLAGSKEADIEWDYGENYGGLAICGYGKNCGLVVSGSGSVELLAGGYLGNGQALTFYPTTTGVGAPSLISSGADTLSIATNDGGASYLQVGAVIETLTTPASSTASCVAGQFTDDANYHYVCVATNTWKRAALSSF